MSSKSRPSTGPGSRAHSAAGRVPQRELPPLSAKNRPGPLPIPRETPGAGAAVQLSTVVDSEEGGAVSEATPELPWGSKVNDWIGNAPGASSLLRRRLRKAYLPRRLAYTGVQMSNWFSMQGFGLPLGIEVA